MIQTNQFHHMKNMGCWRSRLDGILYSKGKYIILFDTGDLYQDNYVLQNAYDVITKYRLDSCKFLFRVLTSFKRLGRSAVFFHVGNGKIVYTPGVFSKWGNIWNRLVRANVYIKGIMQYNTLMLNLYKNVWDDVWFNKIVRRASFSYVIFERIGYVYLQDGKGEGSPQSNTKEEKNKIIKEYIGYLYYEYNFGQANGTKSYIIAPKGLKVGDVVESGKSVDIKVGNAMEIMNIPVGTVIHNIELRPGKGGQLAKSAGASAQILGREGKYVLVRLSSGETRKILGTCRATIGTVGNEDYSLVKVGKAGRKRHMGIRPTVRGAVMNPCDHPHGGGEGKNGIGRPGPSTPWGKPALGLKTRKKNNKSNKLIIRRKNGRAIAK